MMNHRHPTAEERQALLGLTEKIGAVEALRVIAGYIGHNIPDLSIADMQRARLMKVAREIALMPEPEGTKS